MKTFFRTLEKEGKKGVMRIEKRGKMSQEKKKRGRDPPKILNDGDF